MKNSPADEKKRQKKYGKPRTKKRKVKKEERRKIKALEITAWTLVGFAAFALILAAVFWGMQISGRNKLYGESDSRQIVMALSELADEEAELENQVGNWQEGDVRYQGIHYRYNEDMLTFLFLGIDKMTEVVPAKNGIDGGQSDAIFLLAMNPHNKEIYVIGVPRDTMAEIEVYDKYGTYQGIGVGQITLQHGYGDGAAISCERSREAVSKLFYHLPIHGYCSINMGAIPIINDAIGGVELEALEDMDYKNFHVKKGETVKLEGMAAYYYLHNRDVTQFGSAGSRLERQKQYLTAYADAAISAAKKDITLPVTLYNTLSRYMVTDISIDEVSYLASQILGYRFDGSNITTIAGETVRGEKFEEFHADEKALYELILKVFYEEVEEMEK